ncbi:MAG: TAT-variant-translocated molybdopterin oxidoreductase [Planctomycetota bacterium]|nr:TAT-variant-translocated molybdopterin oxidoreductase [Planctomycetota bacterium]
MKHHSTQREYWRSLEDLAQTSEVRQLTEHEFASYDPDGLIKMPEMTRRRFMSLMGASMALAGITLSGCRRWPEEKLAPYTSNPKNRIPGVPEQYATVMELGGVAVPLLVSSFDGRPIKIEGNPSHPFSQTVKGKIGAADAIAQASLLNLYDPDRSRVFIDRTSGVAKTVDWETFVGAFVLSDQAILKQSDGSKFAILSESTDSPTTARLRDALIKKFPKLQWFEYEPLSRDNESIGAKSAIGKAARQMLHLDQARTIVCIDADLLGTHPAHIRYASDWATGRRSADADAGGEMSRLYIAESAFSITGSVADQRLPVKGSRLGAILAGIATNLGIGHESGDALTQTEKNFVNAASADLQKDKGRAVVAVGSHLSPDIQAWALAINAAIGALGTTVTIYEAPNPDRPSHLDSIAALSRQLNDKQVDALLILGGNPVYDAPADLDFATALKNARISVHLSHYEDESSAACTWHLPRAHYLEAWSDARAWDGTISICQPLIEPLYNGKTTDQVLALLAGEPETASDAIVRKTFAGLSGGGNSDSVWRHVLHDGMLPGSEFKTIDLTTINPPSSVIGAIPPAGNGIEVRFLQDSHVYDGRFASNGWLQETPDPLTKLVWDNAALISKKDADSLKLSQGDKFRITIGARTLEIAAYIMAGQPIGVLGLPLGFGRTSAGHIGTDVGFNTYKLRTTAMPFLATGVTCLKTGDAYSLVTTQNHYLLDPIGLQGLQDRVGAEKYESAEIIREATFTDYKRDSQLFQKNEDGTFSLTQQLFNPPGGYEVPHKWGMAIDMNTCIGCQACVVACQAENNVPIVGKDQAQNNRAMHWIRIDRYFKGDTDNPEVVYQPVTCQHCENAPCEQVCPVGATMHDTEGINVMVYNRCVGTRYCSNNCPYKVRRFNYLDWQSQDPRNDKYPMPYPGIPDQQQLEQVNKIKALIFNPEVTIRMRGVMEKCTFCVQRIHNTQTAKRAAGQELVDGDIVTACQQTCPTNAIVFGDLNDPESKVSKLHQNNRAYSLLGDLDTRPRNRFLAKISNPSDA